MNTIDSNFMPGVPGAYKGGRPAWRYVVWRSGRTAF